MENKKVLIDKELEKVSGGSNLIATPTPLEVGTRVKVYSKFIGTIEQYTLDYEDRKDEYLYTIGYDDTDDDRTKIVHLYRNQFEVL